ncbi:MAG TPA: hypothetical protein VL907_08055 [Pyrinomonadaceae bacterium]|nr:hypothetical protein [Pyrinomonadaceae bacterium]
MRTRFLTGVLLCSLLTSSLLAQEPAKEPPSGPLEPRGYFVGPAPHAKKEK